MMGSITLTTGPVNIYVNISKRYIIGPIGCSRSTLYTLISGGDATKTELYKLTCLFY